ncbi:MAG: hypothetical protein K9J27_12045 [Bacteroidales bacterium]|nr:hypothetical protein [Bacteroidales bacterium]MCF8334660.1 hypothetical protein [Bacteroidales bacterium]
MIKTKVLFPFVFLSVMLLVILTTGCEKGLFGGEEDEDGNVYEIKSGSDSQVIRQTIEGIGFEFCLLNENGEPATKFEKGENFVFSLKLNNETSDTIQIKVPVVRKDFFQVFHKTENQVEEAGSPIRGVWCEYAAMPENYEHAPAASLVFKHPWQLEENEPITKYYPFCSKRGHDDLEQGEYFMKFELNLSYSPLNKEEDTEINDIAFKINFQIN